MYIFLLGVQYIGIGVLILIMVHVLKQRATKQQIIMLMLLTALLVNFVGYLFEMTATTLREALRAVQMIYVGKPFIALLMFLFVMEYCRIALPKWLLRFMVFLHMLISILVLTCEHQRLYYSSYRIWYWGMGRCMCYTMDLRWFT